MIHFACPACLRDYKVPEEATGRKTTCRGCGTRLRVPPPAPPTTLYVPPPEAAPAPPAIPTGIPQAPHAEPTQNPRTRLLALGVGVGAVLFLAGLLALTLRRAGSSESPDDPDAPVAVAIKGEIAAEAWCKEFAENQYAFADRYRGRRVRVRGKVKLISTLDRRVFIVSLEPAVMCRFQAEGAADAMALRTGQFAAITGVCAPLDPMFGVDPTLDFCRAGK